MNYLHSYHAGNMADVMKHAVLLLLIRALQEKEGPLTLVDTHAGRGLYDLESMEAGKTMEFDSGISRVWASQEPLLDDYRQLVAAFNPRGQQRYYPGSPAILAHVARLQDFLILNEYHPDEAAALRGIFAKDKQVQVHERDGYELWNAVIPPATPRGLVFVDPPYESQDEWQWITDTLKAAHPKWSHGVRAIWYPITRRSSLWKWEQALRGSGIPKMLQVEHVLYENERADAFNGSGMFIVNPPYKFVQEVSALLEAIRRAVKAPDHDGTIKIEWLTPESTGAYAIA